MNYNNISITKDKIPKGLSYILKSSYLIQSLEDAKINTNVILNFGLKDIFFESFYWLPNQNIDYDRFYIRTGTVKSSLRHEAKKRMEQEVIPEFIIWAKQIIALPQNSTKLKHNLHFYRN